MVLYFLYRERVDVEGIVREGGFGIGGAGNNDRLKFLVLLMRKHG